ncbi:hypothetical protein [Chitinophaga pinensis]|uniref:Uncharacterized protein n=1 Tax=Chitinophaga pinensis (strain ATCC 43595 / DSM 2588 / LMG 13176 / NBRC 15968 / NCIMB 11800 / UQM 2034) TaxID=485918 RepID=A0A979FZH6_CHIPD|nr:hypothetical protein [Chitinophaga pinensis]ACU58074.1 hypothetical protein Cpin_0576 [Chitinophaga pinensis DSM 2588]
MVHVSVLTDIAETRQKDISNTAHILGFKTTVMATTRMLEEADLVDNGNVKIKRGVVTLPAIVRDD